MDVILTHEQADFDAVAALLGARLLQEGAAAVLPRKVNRNVRAFLALFGSELPFSDSRDLPGGAAIDQVTLVDTQSLVTLKGFHKRTAVRVIDHHAARAELDPAWEVRTDPVGATATLLVEDLQQQNLSLTGLQATLLLLGIYEDTGSLSYASTTPRDIRAAAFLMDAGASLRTAVNYLNPPLSEAQRLVYDRLMAAVQTHTVHGMRVVIAAADGAELTEEVSSIAHKMRDLLEPEGLAILVSTPEGCRLVLRSTSDAVNVALLAAHFGGGGHERAAAALVHRPPGRDRSHDAEQREAIRAELVRILPDHIHPPAPVRQIMSHRPRLIAPGTPASEAARLMQRYGYEGFPVVQEGKVLGLLSRRAVDRSLAHKLDLPAASLMEAGAVAVSPDDSIDRLQEVMAESGWGQVPVTDPGTGEIIGIVTRTDLLKVLAARAPRTRTHHLGAQLNAQLAPDQLALLQEVAGVAEALGMAAYVVGGFVRDLLLGRPVADLDIVVEGDAIHLAKALVSRHGGRMVSHHRFGTAKWYLAAGWSPLDKPPTQRQLPASLDLITARTEFYERPTALPTVERSSIQLDLHRRDFTINTMAIRLDGRHYGELLDPYGGYGDLKKGIVRVLHSLSFIDDPTRAIRAIRFEQRFGFRIEERTLHLMLEAERQLKSITGERIRHELDLLLYEERAPDMLNRLTETLLLPCIHPALRWDPGLAERFARLLSDRPTPQWDLPAHLWGYPLRRVLGYAFWLMDLEPGEIETIVERLRIPGNIVGVIQQARALLADVETLPALSPGEASARLDAAHLAAVRCVYYREPSPAARAVIETYLEIWRRITPGIDGRVLLARGVPTGPHYHLILAELKRAWIDGRVRDARGEEQLAEELIARYTRQGTRTGG